MQSKDPWLKYLFSYQELVKSIQQAFFFISSVIHGKAKSSKTLRIERHEDFEFHLF